MSPTLGPLLPTSNHTKLVLSHLPKYYKIRGKNITLARVNFESSLRAAMVQLKQSPVSQEVAAVLPARERNRKKNKKIE
jgi:hypothetical protein